MKTKHHWVRAICLTQAMMFIVPAAPVYAAEKKTITCDSADFTRERCNIDNNGVRLKRQLSASSCREGRDWGYDKRGIWVDNGCEAEFEVTQDRGLSGGEAAAAIIIGGLLLGALMSGDDGDKKKPATLENASTPPNWAVGGFRGRNPYTQRNEDLTIDKKGSVKVIRQGATYNGQWLSGQRLNIQAESYQVERIGGGLRLSHHSGPSSDYFLLD